MATPAVGHGDGDDVEANGAGRDGRELQGHGVARPWTSRGWSVNTGRCSFCCRGSRGRRRRGLAAAPSCSEVVGARDLDAGLRDDTSADPGVGKEAGARGSSPGLTGERMQRLLLLTEEKRERFKEGPGEGSKERRRTGDSGGQLMVTRCSSAACTVSSWSRGPSEIGARGQGALWAGAAA